MIGKYIVDFYIASAHLIIEIDGTQHYEKNGKQYDAVRDAYLESLGCTILRYSNADINLRFESVCADIYNKVMPAGEKPSPRGEGAEQSEADVVVSS